MNQIPCPPEAQSGWGRESLEEPSMGCNLVSSVPSSERPLGAGTEFLTASLSCVICLYLTLDLFSLPVLSLQSPRASCLPFLQACSRYGPPWAPSHLSHLPPAQERLRPLHPLVQVSLLGTATAKGWEEWKRRPLNAPHLPVLTLQQPFLGPVERPAPLLLRPLPRPPALAPPRPLRLAPPRASPSRPPGWACRCLHLLVS